MKLRRLSLAILFITCAILTEISAAANPYPQDQTDTTETVYHKINELNEQDLEHGRIETEKMLHDLPEMRQWVKQSNNPFYSFAVRQFAGEGLGWWLYWELLDEKPGDSVYSPSACLSPTPRRHGEIEIAKFTKYPSRKRAEHYWSCFVYESFNIRNSEHEIHLFRDAALGKINREQFIKKRSESEIETVRRTYKFYRAIVCPWAKKQRITTHGELWDEYTPKTISGWWAAHKDRNGYPWKHYGASYDKLLLQLKTPQN